MKSTGPNGANTVVQEVNTDPAITKPPKPHMSDSGDTVMPATPVTVATGHLDSTNSSQEVQVIKGIEETTSRILEFFSKASKEVNICATSEGPQVSMGIDAYKTAFLGMKKRGVHVRYITELTSENLVFAKELMNYVELRHLEGIKSNFSGSETEYVATTVEMKAGQMIPQMLYTRTVSIVEQQKYMFDLLWRNATEARQKIQEIELGEEPEDTRVVNDLDELTRLTFRAIDSCERELRIVLPSDRALRRNVEMFQHIATAQKAKGFRTRVLSQLSRTKSRSGGDSGISGDNSAPQIELDWRVVRRPFEFAILTFDDKRMFIVEFSDFAAETREQAIRSTIYSTSKNTITGINSFFDGLWSETELAESERKNRRQAQLLQDILAHDISNYIQTSALNAEMLKSEGEGMTYAERNAAIDSILRADERCARLIDRTRQLGRIISQDKPKLYEIKLKESLARSGDAVSRAQESKGRHLDVELSFSDDNAAVLADDLLDEAFTNIFSNAANYVKSDPTAPKDRVVVKVSATKELLIPKDDSNANPAPFWKITFTDFGRGIPDEMKDKLFTRYLEGSSGSGLGLSIVYALIVERYSGSVNIRNRVEGDYHQGTVVELWIPASIPVPN